MIWRVKSYGTLNLLNANYFAFIADADNPNMQPPVSLEIVEVGEAAPADAGMTRNADYLVITVQIKGMGKQVKYDALVMAFDSLSGVSQQLVCLDNTGTEYYVMGRVANHASKAMVSKITLQVADSVWRRTIERAEPWTITASGQTMDITVGGTVEALPIFELTTDAAKTGGFGYRNWCRVYNPCDEAVINELVDITNGGLNTAALIPGKMQADGDDARVYDKGQEVDRQLAGINTTTTKIFAGPFNFSARIEMTLSGTIANSGAVTAIYVKNTAPNKKLLERLPNSRQIVEIDNERYIMTGRDVKALRIDIAERAVRKSSMASHADGALIKWIEHDVWLYYGNSAMEALTIDATHEAAYDIATSTNASRVYTSFGDKAGLRPGAWKLATLKRTAGSDSDFYTGNHGDETADPITDMGMAIKSFLKNGKPTADTASIEMRLSHPGAITSVTVATGEKRRTATKWPATMALQKSKDAKVYANQFNELTPASAGVYLTITNTTLQTLGAGYKHIRFFASGTLDAILNAECDLEIGGLTVVITNPITAALQGEEDNYALDCEIQNETYGESLFLKWTMGLYETLTADSEERRVTHSDGTNAYRAKRLDVARLNWLGLRPGVNRLKFIDPGTSGVTLNTRFVERRKR